jgi:molecular chaperone HtpG
MKEMSAMFGGMNADMFAEEETLVLNTTNALTRKLLELKDDASRADDLRLACEHIYDLAMLSHKPLSVESMTAFIQRSNEIVSRVLG